MYRKPFISFLLYHNGKEIQHVLNLSIRLCGPRPRAEAIGDRPRGVREELAAMTVAAVDRNLYLGLLLVKTTSNGWRLGVQPHALRLFGV